LDNPTIKMKSRTSVYKNYKQ